jgi:putative effector of murein hydrolase LrgA (UPF0299 family)
MEIALCLPTTIVGAVILFTVVVVVVFKWYSIRPTTKQLKLFPNVVG